MLCVEQGKAVTPLPDGTVRRFDAAGMPVDQAGFRAVVRAARRTGNLKPLG